MTEVGRVNNAISLECHTMSAVSCAMIDSPWLFAILEILYLGRDNVDSFAVFLHSGVGFHLLNTILSNGKSAGLLSHRSCEPAGRGHVWNLCGQM